MQIKEIKWTEDIENELLIGSIEDCELFEIETVDNVIILTDITSFDITYPSTVEEAKKNAKEILNKFINKIIVQATINTAKTVIKTINKKVICDELPMKQITKSINSLLKKSDWVKGSGWKVKQTSNKDSISNSCFVKDKGVQAVWKKGSGWKVKPNTITQIINTKSDVKPIEIDWKNVTQMKKILNK